MNFYQSLIWKTISKDIFKKEIFEIDLFWKNYWWVIKPHKKFWIKLRWFQVLGVELPNNVLEITSAINEVKNNFGKFWDIFFQFGFINQLNEPFFKNRKQIENNLKTYGLFPSIRENMPLATVVVDIDKTDEDILKSFSSTARRYVRKAIKEGLYFKIAEKEEINQFYSLWSDVAKQKGFHIYPFEYYRNLLDYLKSSKNWDLYLVKKDNKILAGSIQINEGKNSYYLYWASNKNFLKIWAHYFLKFEMFKYLKQLWIKKVDLLGVSPEWLENHYLKWVSQFKHSLGWNHIEYYGNYDLPLNKLFYSVVKLIK